jgi:hypothetical protein
VADDPGECVPLAHPPGDQLDVLRAEIEDQDGTVGGIGTFHERPVLPGANGPAVEQRRILTGIAAIENRNPS